MNNSVSIIPWPLKERTWQPAISSLTNDTLIDLSSLLLFIVACALYNKIPLIHAVFAACLCFHVALDTNKLLYIIFVDILWKLFRTISIYVVFFFFFFVLNFRFCNGCYGCFEIKSGMPFFFVVTRNKFYGSYKICLNVTNIRISLDFCIFSFYLLLLPVCQTTDSLACPFLQHSG
jgi:hypothetical protein